MGSVVCDDILIWKYWAMKMPDLIQPEWIEMLELAVSEPSTKEAWLSASSWWPMSEEKGQYYLLYALRESLFYKDSHSPREAQKWRDKTLQHLDALSDLLLTSIWVGG